MDMEQPQEQPQPVEAPDLSKRVQGYRANQPLGWLVRQIAMAAGVPLGNVPGEQDEPRISFVRWDHTAAEALDELARICGAKWDVQGGALNFVIGG